MPLAVLAVKHPRATLWPSPPRWEACHLILSRLRLPANQVPLPPQGGARVRGALCSCRLQWSRGQRDNSLFPLEGKCRAAAKGCTRQSVKMIRKGSPDRQTAACLGGVSFEALAVVHPRATLWPSPPKGGARVSGALCSHRLQWSGGKRHHLLFPLEGKCRAAAKGCTRLRVEMIRKGCPDRQTAACLGGVSFEALAVQHPRATTWPSPPQGSARFSGTIPCFPLRVAKELDS